MNKITVKGFKPYLKQLEIIKSFTDEPFKYYTVVTGRQTGKSLIIENIGYYYLINQVNSVNGIISPTYKQVKKLYKAMSKRLKGTPLVKSDNKSELIIELINGSTIQFFSAENYDAIRGNTFTGVLLCDEFAFFKPEAWEEAIKASTLVHCKKVGFFSTPKGKNSSLYNEYMKGMSDEYPKSKSFNFSSYENPFIDREELDEYKRSLPESVFQQEILGIFSDDDSDVFRNIEHICSLNRQSIVAGVKYYIGIDLGNKGDYTVISIFNKEGNQVQLYRFQKNDWNEIFDEIVRVLKSIPNFICYVESNGVGNPIFDRLKLVFKQRVEEFITSNDSKQEIINNLIYAMDSNELKLLKDDNMISELKTFTYKYSKASGKIMYSARNGFHDDCIMATAISYKCKLQNKNEQKIIYERLR